MKNTILVIILICTVVGLRCWLYLRTANASFASKPIICFGDSITEGYQLRNKDTYPYQLGILLGQPIINEGISGETSTQALHRVKWDILKKNPRLVIVQFGGNDPYHQIPYEVTMANNDAIIGEILAAGSVPVLLIGSTNMMKFPYPEGFRKIARQRNILLIDTAIDHILNDRAMSTDGVHPTAQGAKIIAENVAEAIGSLLRP